MNKFLLKFSYLFFPNRCAVCNKVISSTSRYCGSQCENSLLRISDENIALWCRTSSVTTTTHLKKLYFDGYIAPFYHQKGGKQLIYNYKFSSRTDLTDMLATEMSNYAAIYYKGIDFDYVCCVPMRFKKKLSRGYNQSELLAKSICRKLFLNYKAGLLKQIKNKRVQHFLTATARIENVHGIFSVNPSVDVKGKTILLVDDIMSTGASLNECSRVLKRAGADKVYCLLATINL